ncbi:MAG: LysR family transcriptional regulator [Gammaproteobacteria bacterium]|nr:LysR family transcriptional regulator [Gammaproteobacteria bacterium]
MDRFEAMSLLLEAIDAGSLSAAGRRRGVPLATVSRKISDLEAHLNTRLLLRGNRRLELTDAGLTYVEACRRIVGEVREAERAASGEYRTPTGELVITLPIAARQQILPVVAAFLKAYPEVSVRLVQTDRVVSLLEEHADLAVRVGELPDSSLIATRVDMIRLVVCASPEYLSTHGTPRTPEDLATHDCIAFEAITVGNRWDFRRGKSDVAVAIRPRLRVNTAEAAVDAAVAGVGIARALSYQIESAVAAGALEIVLEDYAHEAIPVSLVYPRQGMLPLKLRAFLDFAAPRLRARLPQQAGTVAAKGPLME